MVAPGRRVVITTMYGEDSLWLHEGEPIRGSEPEPPLQLNLVETAILTSGFGVRDDDEWKSAVQLELCEYHGCSVASLPQNPVVGFWARR